MIEKEYIVDGEIEVSAEGIMYWAEEFKCSQHVLKEAISRIGNNYRCLLMYLEMNRLIGDR
jgi:hypothetical protein